MYPHFGHCVCIGGFISGAVFAGDYRLRLRDIYVHELATNFITADFRVAQQPLRLRECTRDCLTDDEPPAPLTRCPESAAPLWEASRDSDSQCRVVFASEIGRSPNAFVTRSLGLHNRHTLHRAIA